MYHKYFRALDNSGADPKKKNVLGCVEEVPPPPKTYFTILQEPLSMVDITVIVEENDKGYHDFLRFACKRYLKGKTRTTTRSKDFLRFRSKAY